MPGEPTSHSRFIYLTPENDAKALNKRSNPGVWKSFCCLQYVFGCRNLAPRMAWQVPIDIRGHGKQWRPRECQSKKFKAVVYRYKRSAFQEVQPIFKPQLFCGKRLSNSESHFAELPHIALTFLCFFLIFGSERKLLYKVYPPPPFLQVPKFQNVVCFLLPMKKYFTPCPFLNFLSCVFFSS